MKLYNSLSRKIEVFTPLKPPKVGLYTCGPTVYQYAHIGNFRTYLLGDLVYRTLTYLDYQVDYIMNLTDVGHLTGDNLGDADQGEDRMEKSAEREGKSAWEIADYYTQAFLTDFDKLNLVRPRKFTKATDHIPEQIELVEQLMGKGYAYSISDGIYFDTSKFPQYGALSTLAEIKAGARVEPNVEKRNPRDFALWKFSPKDVKRQMEWDSPWGIGFPGWHIECSAMSMKYLGETFDIHVGGEDLRSTHHPNEIAQSESATGKKFVRYWLHGAFILINGKRMSKSAGNFYTLTDLISKNIHPMDLRYLYLTAHYRDQLNITLDSLSSCAAARKKLLNFVRGWRERADTRSTLSTEKLDIVTRLNTDFTQAVSDDLNLPQAISIVWEMAKSMIPDREKLDLITSWDRVLGLNIVDLTSSRISVPTAVKKLLGSRKDAREAGNFALSDKLRREISSLGWAVEDTPDGQRVTQK